MKHAGTAGTVSEQQTGNGNGQTIGSMEDVLHGLVGHVITVINPQTFTPTLAGYKIDSSAVKAKVLSCENGLLRLLTEFLSDPHRKVKEKAQLFVPVAHVKRVMVSQSTKLLTL